MSSNGSSAPTAATTASGAQPPRDRWLLCCVCEQPLRNPIQLQCLHNCCACCVESVRILSDDAAIVGGSRGPPAAVSVHCPACDETCRATAGRGPTDELNANAFVESQLRRQLDAAKRAGPATCECCKERPQPAELWCDQCCKRLCSDCQRWHSKFSKQHVVVPLAAGPRATAAEAAPAPAAAGAEPPPLRCPQHRSQYEFSCRQCRSLKCAKCMQACVAARHALANATADDVAERVRKAAASVRDSQRALLAAAASVPVGDFERLVDGLDAARAADARRLEASRDRAAAELESAYAAAARSLGDAHDAARLRAQTLLTAARAVSAGAELARAYGEALLASGDSSGLAHQQDALLSRARMLQKRAAALRSSPLPAADDCVRLEPAQDADNLAGALRKCFGEPRPVPATEGLFAASVNGHIGGIFDNAGDDDDDDGGEVSALRFEPSSGTGALAAGPCECADVAVTVDGHVLLAVLGSPGERGLKEFDADGRELRHWPPPRLPGGGAGQSDFVWAVEALDDGRVAAGLLHAQYVQVLRRGPAADSWVRDQKITTQLHPWRLSTFGDALVVAGGRLPSAGTNAGGGGGGATLAPGPHLVVFGAALAGDVGAPLKLELGYDVHGLALSASAVVVSSSSHAPAARGGGGGEPPHYAVEALSRRDGAVLWRYRSNEPVVDVCAHGAVLYLATAGDSGRLLAVGSRDGKKLAAAADGVRLAAAGGGGGDRAAPSTKPLCAAMRATERRVVLAVLFSDRRSTRTYSAAAAV